MLMEYISIALCSFVNVAGFKYGTNDDNIGQ